MENCTQQLSNEAVTINLLLTPLEVCHLRAASREDGLARAADSDAVWSAQCSRVFGGTDSLPCVRGPFGEDCGGSWLRAFSLWFAAATEVGLGPSARCLAPLPVAWIPVWCRLLRGISLLAPTVTQTLRPAAGPAAYAAVEEALGVSMAPAVAGLWRVFDGQEARLERGVAEELGLPCLGEGDEWAQGLFGGYAAYDHEVSTVLLPLRNAVRLTLFLQTRVAQLKEQHRTKLAFACSFNLSKIFFVDISSGAVHAWTRRPSPLMELAVPLSRTRAADCLLCVGLRVRMTGLQTAVHLNGQAGTAVRRLDNGRWQVTLEDGSDKTVKPENLEPLEDGEADGRALVQQESDGLLRWVAEFARRLHAGIYSRMPLRPESSPATSGICLFPVSGRELSRCVTRGVEVTASAVYMPEHQQGWTYSVTLRLQGTAEARGFEQCQLRAREWEIRTREEEAGGAREPERVQGEGVIGFFPIICDGGWRLDRESDPHGQYSGPPRFVDGPFRYQSCSGRRASMQAAFGGSLTFVPGTIKQPTGKPFQAKLLPFRLYVPDHIY